MWRILRSYGIVSFLACLAFAAPILLSHPHALPQSLEPSFFLRATSPNNDWNDQRLVALPRSHQLGIQNSTIQPSNPPLKFHPIQLANGAYALSGEADAECAGDKKSLTPYLAALESTTGTRTASMSMIYTADPTQINPEACPKGYKCVADQWTFDAAGDDGVYKDFGYAGYKGEWTPFQDAGVEGWHVYWKGDSGDRDTIGLELAPVSD